MSQKRQITMLQDHNAHLYPLFLHSEQWVPLGVATLHHRLASLWRQTNTNITTELGSLFIQEHDRLQTIIDVRKCDKIDYKGKIHIRLSYTRQMVRWKQMPIAGVNMEVNNCSMLNFVIYTACHPGKRNKPECLMTVY